MTIEEQIKERLNPHIYKDRIRLTYGFGVPTDYPAEGGHQGIDIGEQNFILGDNLYAPFDGIVYIARTYLGESGWTFIMQSNPVLISGKQCSVRLLYIHTRGKSTLKDGDSVKRGDVVDISGGIFSLNQFWKGQHTHVGIMPRYFARDPDINFWQPEWFNGHGGFVDPLQCINPVNPDVEKVYVYYKENKMEFFKWGVSNVRMDTVLRILKLDYTSRQMLGLIYDYTLLKSNHITTNY